MYNSSWAFVPKWAENVKQKDDKQDPWLEIPEEISLQFQTKD